MTSSPDETYIHTYQKYLKQKDNSDDLRKAISSHTASIKVIKTVLKNKECKICKVLARPEDLNKVLNQGLYHKYTSSQDYFYTRDINSLLLKKRNEFTVRYNDDLIYDESKERLKGYFKRKETASIMNEIKQFYSQFKNFPRNFQTQFFRIINSNIRKHRRLEYIKVFNGVNLDDDKPQSEDSNQSSASKPDKDNGEFVFMEMLGSSFLQDNYKDLSGIVVGGLKLDKRRDTEQSLMDLDSNFKAIYKIPKNAINDPASAPFSNALYNNNYMLYSRNDSETAEDILKQIVQEFREVDLSRKASISLAEKVLNRVTVTPKNVTRQENRCSPTLKPRISGGGIELSPTITASKKSLGSNNVTIAMNISKQQSIPLSTSQRVSSNPRNNSRVETESTLKSSQSKVLEQRKSNAKFPTEHLNDLSLERNKILSSVYQFRSTRSKSGGLKTMNTSSKTPTTSKLKRPLAINCDMSQGQDSTEPKQMQTAYYINKKSPSPSPERKFESNILQPKDSKINALKRSTSQGRNLNIKEVLSPANVTSGVQSVTSAHSKAGSIVKRAVATPKKQKPAVMVQNLMTSNTSGSTNNVSNSITQENPGTPNNLKFINPLKAALGNPQPFYFRHQSPIDERMTPVSLGLHPVKSEAKFKNLNMRAVKNASPKRTDSNSRVNTLSISGRNQNMLDISQGMGSSACTQSSFQANKTTTTTTKRKKVGKADMQILGGPKISKRNTDTPATLNQTTSPSEETMIKDKKGKKHLELSDTNFLSYKDLRLSTSKDQTPSNLGPSSTTSLSKYKVDMNLKKNGFSSYTLKGSTKDLRMSLKK